MNEYVTAQGGEVHGVGVIQSNPDQSKHLETATMKARRRAPADPLRTPSPLARVPQGTCETPFLRAHRPG